MQYLENDVNLLDVIEGNLWGPRDWSTSRSHDASHMIQSFPQVIHSGLDTT